MGVSNAVSIPNPMPVAIPNDRTALAQIFDEWAVRNGYVRETFSGEVAVPATGETNLINLVVPAGETWYRRRAWYTSAGSTACRFKLYRTIPPASEVYSNLVVVRNNDTHEIEVNGKYPAGSRIRITVMAGGTVSVGDVATARIQYIALPWVE